MTRYSRASAILFGRRAHQWLLLTAMLGLCLVLALSGAAPACADTTFIVTTTNDGNTGGTLRGALAAASSKPGNSVITFAPGVTGVIQLTDILPQLTGSISIQGPGARFLTVRLYKGAHSHTDVAASVFNVASAASANISGLTMDGSFETQGFVNGSYPDISDVINRGTLVITDCAVIGGDSLQDGAGIYNEGKLTVTRCAIANNYAAGNGAGIWNSGALLLSNSTLSSNIAGYDGLGVGGGLYNAGSALIDFCTISNNFGNNEVEIESYDHDDWNRVRNVGDTGGGGGGGVEVITLQAPGDGIFCSAGHVNMSNTILYADTADVTNYGSNKGTDHFSRGNNISSDDTGPSGATDRRNTNPGLDPAGLQYNGGLTPTVALLAGSAAIDAGNAALSPATDQRGAPRPVGAGVDVGAVEFQPILHIIITGISVSRATAGVVNVTLIVQNTGNVPLNNIQVANARLRVVSPLSPESTPDPFSLAPNAIRGMTLLFDGGRAGIAPGSTVFVFNGSYTGGTFSVGSYVTVPPLY